MNNTTTTSTDTTIGPVINGDLVWTTPSVYDDLDLDDIFTFQLKPENFDDFKVPDTIKKLQIIVFEDDLIAELDTPVIPSTITDLDIHLDFDYEKGYDYSSVVKMVKQLKIPSSVVSLTISNKSMITGIDNVIKSILESDLRTTKKRKTDGGENGGTQETHDYFIPSSVTKLNVPWVSKEMTQFIPPTVDHLVFHIEKTSFNIPNTVKHVEIVKTTCKPKLQKVAFFSKLPKELETLTTGDHFLSARVPFVHFRFDLDHLQNNFKEQEFRTTFSKVTKQCLREENILIQTIDIKDPSKEGTGDIRVFFYLYWYKQSVTIPDSVKNVYYESKNTCQFNNGLEYLILNIKEDFSKFKLSQTLKYLFIKGEEFRYEMNFSKHVPSSVSHLEITLNECLNFNGFIPQGVKYLKINIPTTKSKHQINIKIPSTLVHLQIDKEYIDNIKVIPRDEYFNINININNNINNNNNNNNNNSNNGNNNLGELLNTSVTKLDLTNYPNHYIPPYSLPPNLEEIIFGNIAQPIEKGLIPTTVKRITFNPCGVRFKSINFEFLPNLIPYFKFCFNDSEIPLTSNTFDVFMLSVFTKPTVGQVLSVKKAGASIVSIKIKNLEFYGCKSNNTKTKIDIAKFKFPIPSFSHYHQDEKGTYILSFANYPPKKLSLGVKKYPMPIRANSSLYSLVSQCPGTTTLNLLNYQYINPSLLPKSVTDLTINYETNEPFLLKPKQETQIQDDSNNRFTYSEPLKPDTELFFYIWKNTFIRNNIIDQLLHPSQELVQVCQTTPTNKSKKELFITNSYQLSSKKNAFKGVSKIHLSKSYLSNWSNPFTKSVLKLMNIKYHVYQKDKAIPSGTTHIIWPLNEPIPAGLLPNTVYSITFGYSYNQPILPNTLGDNVLELQFGNGFVINIENSTFPPRLRYLTFGSNYRHPIVPNTLPSTLKHIYFMSLTQDSELLNSLKHLPPSVDHLGILKYDSNLKDLTMISPFIKYIKLSHGHYNQNLVVPTTVKSVRVSKISYVKISHDINSLTTPTSSKEPTITTPATPTTQNAPSPAVKLESPVNVKLVVEKTFLNANSLVDNVKSITISTNFVLIPGCLPVNLESLKFNISYNQAISHGV
ncbi:hypothetical protein CYY_010156, partial [Polysphondylium violaceum]